MHLRVGFTAAIAGPNFGPLVHSMCGPGPIIAKKGVVSRESGTGEGAERAHGSRKGETAEAMRYYGGSSYQLAGCSGS